MTNLIRLIKKSNKIALFSHISPDPDTIGSSLAFYYALKQIKKDVSLFCDDEDLERFAFLGAEKIYNISNSDDDYDLCIAIDIATLDRIGRFEKCFQSAPNIRFDHHSTGDDFANLNIMKPYSACAVLIYEIITKMKIKIDENIATLLYFGICGDTGGFRYSNTDSKSFEIAAKLLDYGADIKKIYSEFFDKKTVTQIKLSSNTILNAEINDNLGYVMMKVRSGDFQKFGAGEGEYLGNLPHMYLNCGYKIACIIKEKSDGVKASLRSKAEYDCSKIAEVFDGGGHKNASGIKFADELKFDDAAKLLEREIANYLKAFKGESL